MDNEQLLAFIQSLPPEQQAQMMKQFSQQGQQQDPRMGIPGAFEDYEGQDQIINEQMSQAQALRNQKSTQGTMAGGQYMAANPLARLADVGNKFIGAHIGKKAREAKDELSKKKSLSLQLLSDRILDFNQNAEENEDDTPMETMARNQNRQGYA